MPIAAVSKECNLNALPKIELQMQGVDRTICKHSTLKGRGDRDLVIFEIICRWVKCSRVHFLEAEKQVQLPVARRFSGKQRGPKLILRHLYPNHPKPSKPPIINLFV